MFILTLLSVTMLFLSFTGWMLLTSETGQFGALVTKLEDYQSDLLSTTRAGRSLVNTTIASLLVIRSTATGGFGTAIGEFIATANESLALADAEIRAVHDVIDIELHLGTARVWASNLRLWIGLAGGGTLFLFLVFMFPSAIITLGQTILGPCDRNGRWTVSFKPLTSCTRCWNLTSVMVWSILLIPFSIGMAVAFYALSEAMAEICRIGPYQIVQDFVDPPVEVQYYFDTCNSTAPLPFADQLLRGSASLTDAGLSIQSIINVSLDYNMTETAEAANETLALVADGHVLLDRFEELAGCSKIEEIKKDALTALCDRIPVYLFLVFLGVLCYLLLFGMLYLCISMRPLQPVVSSYSGGYDDDDNTPRDEDERRRLLQLQQAAQVQPRASAFFGASRSVPFIAPARRTMHHSLQ
jgi:hypothetical protein